MLTSTMKPLCLVLLATLAAACSAEPSEPPAARRAPALEPSVAGPPPRPVGRDEVASPREEGAPVEPSDYVATEGAFRLFGVEPGDDSAGRSAIVADTRTWSTRAYREGDWIGRGLRVARIGEASVTLVGPAGPVVLEAGADVRLRIVRHKLDVVAQPLGRHRYALDPAAARAARAALPTFERVELYGGPALKLGPVAAGTLLAEADFREGDLVALLEDAPVTDETLAELARGLTEGRPSLRVRVYRGGVPLDRVFFVR